MSKLIKSGSLFAGECVEVRSRAEILSTLDNQGHLEGLPFMPEMFECCGKRYRVFKRAHKTCDPPDIGARRMDRAVHLEGVRCNGAGHGGCQAGCLIFWKEAWLKRVDVVSGDHEAGNQPRISSATPSGGCGIGCSEEDVQAATQHPAAPDSANLRYYCQATQLGTATQPQQWWNPFRYLEDYLAGNVKPSQMMAALIGSALEQVATAGLGLGACVRWVYDSWQSLHGGCPYPWRIGRIPKGKRTPSRSLNLSPGELVRIRPFREILDTLDEDSLNRGMRFDPELVPYCGGTYRVQGRVSRIINERTGQMQSLKNDCIILEDVVCRACYAKYRRFCSRSIYPYWREVWLERIVDQEPAVPSSWGDH